MKLKSGLVVRQAKVIVCLLGFMSLHLSSDSSDIRQDMASADALSAHVHNLPKDEEYSYRRRSVLDLIMLTRPELLEQPVCFSGKLVPGDQQANVLFKAIYNRRIVFADGNWVEFYYLPFVVTSWGGVTSYCVRDNSVFLGSGDESIVFSARMPGDFPNQGLLRLTSGQTRFEVKVRETACIYRRCAKPLPVRVAIIGNSITFHPPRESVGWSGNWGMAASSKEADYVHILARKLDVESIATYASGSWERNIKNFRLDSFKNNRTGAADLASFAPDLVILNIGENIGSNAYATDDLEAAILKLIDYVRTETRAEVILVDSFYQQANVNRSILTAAIKAQTRWVGMRPLAGVPEYRAHEFFDNDSVGSHPSDLGMEKIASLILEVIQ